MEKHIRTGKDEGFRVESYTGHGEPGPKPLPQQSVNGGQGEGGLLRQWLVCLAQKEKALGKGDKLIYMDNK